MTLEVLFARACQGQTFLRMAACGLVSGALLQACLALGRRFAGLRALWDALTALAMLGMALPVMLRSGEGVRAYGLLGLAIGGALYAAGLRRIVSGAAAWMKKHQKPAPQKQEVAEGVGK